jgi:hypothetical protein
MIGPAQPSDRTAIADLHRRNRPDTPGRLEAVARATQQALVARDDEGHVIGVALVIFLDCGVAPYGVIHQLHVAFGPAPGRYDVRDELIEACASWLHEQGAELVYARTVDRGTDAMAMLRYTRSRRWVLDPETGQVNDAGPAAAVETQAPGAAPQPVRAARWVTN